MIPEPFQETAVDLRLQLGQAAGKRRGIVEAVVDRSIALVITLALKVHILIVLTGMGIVPDGRIKFMQTVQRVNVGKTVSRIDLYITYTGRNGNMGGIEAVRRELSEETGIEVDYLEQLYTFGAPDRDPRQRIISVAYVALVKSSQYRQLKASTDAEDAQWFSIKALPELAFDHKTILQTAIDRVRAKIRYQPIGFELLDKKFPIADLEKLYTTLLDRDIDRRNFSKKIMALAILDETDEYVKATGAGRPGKLYKFNKKRYQQLVKDGIIFEI
ncbi:hydrolase, NUDIX family [Ostertagia ostertagi]